MWYSKDDPEMFYMDGTPCNGRSGASIEQGSGRRYGPNGEQAMSYTEGRLEEIEDRISRLERAAGLDE